MIRARRRAVVRVAAGGVGLLVAGIVLWVSLSGGGSASGTSYVGGSTNAVLYGSGHRASAPGFSGTTITGQRFSSASYRGKVMVINFWGSWCSPCRAEAATLAVIAQQYKPDGVAFVGIDVGDNPASAVAFEHSHGIGYPSVSDPGYAIAQRFGTAVPVSSTPTTVVVDKTGRVAGAVFGSATYSELTAILAKVKA